MAQDWNIKQRAALCSGCERAFADREDCTSALRRGEEGFERSDYCDVCWERDESQEGVFSTWSGEFRVPEAAPEEALKKETAESLLRRLVESDTVEHENVIYILAVMLERQRILIERDVRKLEDGSLLRVYERRKSGETFLIHDPQLELGELTHVQEQVVTMLGPRPGSEEERAATAAAEEAAETELTEEIAAEAQGEGEPEVAAEVDDGELHDG